MEFLKIVDCFLGGYGSYSNNLLTFEIKCFLVDNFSCRNWSGGANETAITVIISPTIMNKRFRYQVALTIRQRQVAKFSHSLLIIAFFARTWNTNRNQILNHAFHHGSAFELKFFVLSDFEINFFQKADSQGELFFRNQFLSLNFFETFYIQISKKKLHQKNNVLTNFMP